MNNGRRPVQAEQAGRLVDDLICLAEQQNATEISSGDAAEAAGKSVALRAIGMGSHDIATLRAAEHAHASLCKGEKYDATHLGTEHSRRLLWTALVDRYQFRLDFVDNMLTGLRPNSGYLRILADWAARPADPDADVTDWDPSNPCANGGQFAIGDWYALVGASGTGKSTVGRRLSTLTGRRYVDLDQVVEARGGRPLPELFRTLGSLATFRLYSRIIEDWMLEIDLAERAVVSFGAGSVLTPVARACLYASRVSVWMTAPPAVLASRIASEPRHAAYHFGSRAYAPMHRYVQLARSPVFALAQFWMPSQPTPIETANTLRKMERAFA